MIGKIIMGKSFRGCISYVLENKHQKSLAILQANRAELISYNQCYGNKKELIAQFNDVRNLNPRLAKPVMHLILSLSPGEMPAKSTLIAMTEDCAKEMGFDKQQYIAVTHNDTGHLHLHLVVNRVGFDGKTLSDSNNYKKIANCCRKLEQVYQLRQVQSPSIFLPKEKQHLPRLDRRKEQMKTDIRLSLLASKSFEEFIRLMKQKNYVVIKGRGIAFRDEKKMYVKGSELGYSLSKIQHILSQTEQKKRLTIHKDLQKEKYLKTDISDLLLKRSNSLFKENDPDLDNILELLLKPEEEFDYTPKELLRKKREQNNNHSHRH